jgi:SMP-30/Gluconolactonase/LRE-like region
MGNIQMLGKSSGPMYRGEKPLETALFPTGLLDNLADHAVDFWLTTEDLPDSENRVTVGQSGKVTLSYTPNNQVPTRKLYDQLKSMLGRLGLHLDHLIPRNVYMKTEIPIAGCAHQAGTCRFTDPLYGISNDYEGGRQASEQPPAVYRFEPETGDIRIVADDFDGPNGLAFSPDETRLYIAETGIQTERSPRQYIRAFNVGPDGVSLPSGDIFHKIQPG